MSIGTPTPLDPLPRVAGALEPQEREGGGGDGRYLPPRRRRRRRPEDPGLTVDEQGQTHVDVHA